jgi:hypothetical protein
MRRTSLLALLLSLIAAACDDPGWTIWVRNDTDQTQFLRYVDGPTTLVSVGPRSAGFLGTIGGGPRSVDLVDDHCRGLLASVAVAQEGGTFVVIQAQAGVSSLTAAPTDVPTEITDPNLAIVPGVCP